LFVIASRGTLDRDPGRARARCDDAESIVLQASTSFPSVMVFLPPPHGVVQLQDDCAVLSPQVKATYNGTALRLV